MRPSKGDIRDGQSLKDVEEVFVVAFYFAAEDSQRFSDAASAFRGFCVIEKTSLILKSSATQKFSVGVAFCIMKPYIKSYSRKVLSSLPSEAVRKQVLPRIIEE